MVGMAVQNPAKPPHLIFNNLIKYVIWTSSFIFFLVWCICQHSDSFSHIIFFLFSFMKGDNPARITDNRRDALTLPASEHSFQYPNDPNNYYNQQFQHYGQSRQLEGIMKLCWVRYMELNQLLNSSKIILVLKIFREANLISVFEFIAMIMPP